jgi:HlyD family secretion protein
MKPPALCSSRNRLGRLAAHGLSLVLIATLASCGGEGDDVTAEAAETIEVKQGPLRISVKEGGDLESGRPVSVRSQVEGRTTIIELIEEGSHVIEGQLLCRLDSSALEDNLNRQQIELDRATSDLSQAEESLAIQEKANNEDTTSATSDLELARNALQAYIEGTKPLEIKKLQSGLTVAEEELKRAETEEASSKRLFEKEIISKSDWDADILRKKKAFESVEIAKAQLAQFMTWTAGDEIKRLETSVAVKEMALDRVKQQCDSNRRQKEDIVQLRKRNLLQEQERFEKLQKQLEWCIIKAPKAGLVVYGRSSRGRGQDEPISLGKEVRESEEIIQMPDLTNMVVEVDIHESSIKKVQRGQRAWITVDALPGTTFQGSVSHVSLVPSTESSWTNPDLKVYRTVVRLEGPLDDDLKPGMHAQVEILVAEIPDAISIPLQCVAQSGSKSFVYVKKGDQVDLREIILGLNNESAVHVTSNLEAGELVYLSKPKGAPELPRPEKREFLSSDTPANDGPGPDVPPFNGGGPGGEGGRPPSNGNVPASADGGGRRRGGRRGAGGPGGAGPMGNLTEDQRAKVRGMSGEERRKYFESLRPKPEGGQESAPAPVAVPAGEGN